MDQILVTRSSMPPMEEYISEISDLWDSHWLTNMGQKHRQLSAELQNYLDVDHIELFCNGHMSLELCLQAMNLSGEVITTPYTFASTTHAIVRNGLTPVFCDIYPDNYTIDVDKIESLITERTSAIVPVHVYGNICDVEAIDRIARKHNLKVIYDACHAFGIKYKGRSIASFGDASVFSFHATKVFNTIEGGCVCFHDNDLSQKLSDLKNFGIHNEETISDVGANAKLNEFSCAMGLCNLRHLDDEIKKRQTVMNRYRLHLESIPGIQLSPVDPDVISNYGYLPIVIDETVFGANRNQVREELESHGIHPRKYFYPIVNEFDCYKDTYSSADTPVALEISKSVLTLPMYADLDLDKVDEICSILLEMRR